MSKWININTQKPPYPGRYLVNCDIEGQQLVCILYFYGECFLEGEVTHWMPLPKPAKEE